MCFLTGLTHLNPLKTQIRRLGEVQRTGQRAGHLMSWPNTNSEDPESHCWQTGVVEWYQQLQLLGSPATPWASPQIEELCLAKCCFRKMLQGSIGIYRQHRVGGMLETSWDLESKGKTTKLLKNLPLPKFFKRGFRAPNHQILSSHQAQSAKLTTFCWQIWGFRLVMETSRVDCPEQYFSCDSWLHQELLGRSPIKLTRLQVKRLIDI